jgi:hypothetical protein
MKNSQRFLLNTMIGFLLLSFAGSITFASDSSPLIPGQDEAAGPDPFALEKKISWYNPEKLTAQWLTLLQLADGRYVSVRLIWRKKSPVDIIYPGVHIIVYEKGQPAVTLFEPLADPAETVLFSNSSVVLGSNVIEKTSIGEGNGYSLAFQAADSENSISIDATLLQTISPCRNQAYPLLISEKLKNYVEYEIVCPRGQLSGYITINGKKEPLQGTGFIETFRWLKSETQDPLTWHRAIAQAGPYFILLQKAYYPDDGSLFLLASSDGCMHEVVDGDFRVTENETGQKLYFKDDKMDLEITLEPGAEKLKKNVLHILPYSLRFMYDGQPYSAEDVLFYEAGNWKSL